MHFSFNAMTSSMGKSGETTTYKRAKGEGKMDYRTLRGIAYYYNDVISKADQDS